MVAIKDLENTGYKMSWLVMSSWRCCVAFLRQSRLLPPSTAALRCLSGGMLCKCVVTLFPVRNSPADVSNSLLGWSWVRCCREMWTVGCDVWASAGIDERGLPEWIRQNVTDSPWAWWIDGVVIICSSLVKTEWIFTPVKGNLISY